MQNAPERRAYEFQYDPGTIVYGPGRVSKLTSELDRTGISRPILVCGENVGSSPEVINPVISAVGNRLVEIFDRTSPEKRMDTALDGLRTIRRTNADALVCIGGGSTFDIARTMAVLATTEADPETLNRHITEAKTLPDPDQDVTLLPLFFVPTTLAGADMSRLGGVRYRHTPIRPPEGDPRTAVVADDRTFPTASVYDPELFATTPTAVLCGSAMNGFNKGIETLYSRYSDPITDQTSIRGLQLLREALPELRTGASPVIEQAVSGIVLVQYGFSTPRNDKFSVIHGFAHGFSVEYDIQQGHVHGILAPEVLSFLFDEVSACRNQIARALDISREGAGADELATDIVETVEYIRDELGTKTRLREIPDLKRSHLPAIASVIHDDPCMDNGPAAFDPDVGEIEAVLQRAW